MSDGRSKGFTGSSVPEAYERYMLQQIFVPWAADLVARAGLQQGQHVLDVASGLGPVARLAATTVGPTGRVVASDISGAMLELAAAKAAAPGAAPIDYLECSASSITIEADRFDVVLCQQGLQFFPDRAIAVAEMVRVVRPGGTVAVSTWSAEHPLGLFGPIAEAMAAAELTEPYPGAFAPDSYTIGTAELEQLLSGAGLGQVTVETVQGMATWDSMELAVSTLLATPFGPTVTALDPDRQAQIRDDVSRRLGQVEDGPVVIRTAANVAIGRS
jgi:ubiquinone/menaquinone biosynthesis C-methylase UbiE